MRVLSVALASFALLASSIAVAADRAASDGPRRGRPTAAALPRPADLIVEASGAASPDELGRWKRALGLTLPKAPPPTSEQVGAGLAKLINLPSLDGIDLKKPVRVLVLDPKGYPDPIVLVGQVASAPRLKATIAAQATPSRVALSISGSTALLGSTSAIGHVAAYATTQWRNAPKDGVRVVAYLPRIWASYGAQVMGMKTFLVGTSAAQGGPSAATLGSIFDAVASGIEQATDLTLELSAADEILQLTLFLATKPGTPIAQFAEAQRPAEFSLLGKLAAGVAAVTMAGRLDLSSTSRHTCALILGKDDDATCASWEEMARLITGELAMAGDMRLDAGMSMQYLIGTADSTRLLQLVPKLLESMGGGMLGGMVKMKRTELPPTTEDGLSIARARTDYDFSGLPAHQGPKQLSTIYSWTGWDGMCATAASADGSTMKRLLGAARHGQDTMTPSPAQRASVARARADKDSMWVWLDFSQVPQVQGKPTPLPSNLALALTFGATGGTPRIRFALSAR